MCEQFMVAVRGAHQGTLQRATNLEKKKRVPLDQKKSTNGSCDPVLNVY